MFQCHIRIVHDQTNDRTCSNVTSGLYMIKQMTEHVPMSHQDCTWSNKWQRTVLWMCKLIGVINVCWLFIVCSQIFCHCGLISSSSVSTIEYKLSKCTYKCTIVHWILRFGFFFVFFFFFNFLEIKNRTISSIYSFKFVCWL
jgi:hypothetical protein